MPAQDSGPLTTSSAPERAVREHVMAARRESFSRLHDLRRGRGLEIGPLDRAIAHGDDIDVRYVDVHPADRIRAQFAEDPNVFTDLVPEIDFPLVHEGRIRSLREAAAPAAPYDWVVASHVVEHVPDLVGWLADVAAVTKPGGVLVLAVPDRRYCFDRHRPPTTTGQVIEAHESGVTRPTIRAVYDHFRSAVAVDPLALWAGDRPPGREARMYTLAEVDAQLERARLGEYVDSHVWTFTPSSFVAQLHELRELGLCDWTVSRVEEVPNDVEFHAVLRHGSGGGGHDEAAGGGADLPDWLEAEWSAQDRIRRLEAKVRRLRRRNARLAARLEELEHSTSLRVGRALVAPAGALRTRWSGRRRAL